MLPAAGLVQRDEIHADAVAALRSPTYTPLGSQGTPRSACFTGESRYSLWGNSAAPFSYDLGYQAGRPLASSRSRTASPKCLARCGELISVSVTVTRWPAASMDAVSALS